MPFSPLLKYFYGNCWGNREICVICWKQYRSTAFILTNLLFWPSQILRSPPMDRLPFSNWDSTYTSPKKFKFIRHSLSGPGNVIVMRSHDFNESPSLQLWIDYNHQIRLPGSSLGEVLSNQREFWYRKKIKLTWELMFNSRGISSW